MVVIIRFDPISSYKIVFSVHFCFEAHFLPQNFSNVNNNVPNEEMTIIKILKKIRYDYVIYRLSKCKGCIDCGDDMNSVISIFYP